MSLDFPATASALWSGFVAGKLPRPEYLLPCLYSESGFNPAATNSINCQGLNQLCPFAWPIPAGYATWSASQQIAGPITSMFGQIIQKFGPLNSGTRTYLANFLPAYLATAKTLPSVIATKGGAVYSANSGLDWQHTGTIKVSDLAHFIGKAAANPTVKSAIAQTYAQRPNMQPLDPVYGTDFPNPSTALPGNRSEQLLVAGGILAILAAGATVAWDAGVFNRLR